MPAFKPSSYQHDDDQPRATWFDRFAHLQASSGHYLRDIGGILLLALALMLFLALTGLTKGILLGAAADFLLTWLGLGSVFVVALLVWGGVVLLWKGRQGSPLGVSRVVALELAACLLLGLLAFLGPWLAAMSGDSRTPLERAEAGLDGGRVGWAISALLDQFLGPFGGFVILLLTLAVSIVVAFGLAAAIEHWLFRMGGQAAPVMPGYSSSLTPDEFPFPPEEPPLDLTREPSENPKRKPAAALPPEFRKALKMPEAQDERPAAPRERGERLPPLNLLLGDQSVRPDEKTINQTAGLIEKTLSEFGIPAQVVGFRVGPTVTQFAVQPGFIKKPGSNEDDQQLMKVRVAQISALDRDLALALSADRLRIEAPVPG